jgi:hypothetical protein
MEKKDNKTTTIKISSHTRDRLEHLREHKEESADSLINKTLNILNICLRSPALASRILRDIEKSKKRKEILENSDTTKKKKNNLEVLDNIKKTNESKGE